MNKRLFIFFTLITLGVYAAFAQIANPVKWKTAVKMTDATNGVVTFTATIDAGWHVYGTNIPNGGPQPTAVKWNNEGVKLVGGLTPNKPAHKQHDDTFDMDLSWWSGSVTLTQKFTVTAPSYNI